MAYVNRPYGGSYCESDRVGMCDTTPYGGGGAYGADYRVDEYGNRIYHHRNALGNEVAEIVTTTVPNGPHHHNHNHNHNHHYGRPAEYIERREGCIADNAYDPYRGIY